MQIILISGKYGKSRVLSKRLLVLFLVLLVFALAAPAAWLMRPSAQQDQTLRADRPFTDAEILSLIDTWQQGFLLAFDEVSLVTDRSENQVQALTHRLAALQAHMERIDALAEQLLVVAGIDSTEFNFSGLSALGGPVDPDAQELRPPSFIDTLNEMESRLQNRVTQLGILQDLLQLKQFEESTFVAGRPVKTGWISSRFGRRTDPFTGRVASHGGVDFAARPGTPIHAVAAGVVSYAADRGDYGLLVDINHGDGLVTRYAHSQELLVAEGDLVRKGDVIALIGSTGRSTGPHLHFEVLINGTRVDPLPFIQRQSAGR